MAAPSSPAGPPSLRPMVSADVGAVDVLTARTFGHLFPRFGIPSPPQRDARGARRARGRLSHLLLTDPDGSVVATDDDDRVVGLAMSAVREGTWVLSLLIVDPQRHSAGLGRRLLDAVLPAPDVPGLIAASPDPRAIALYAAAGFRPRPTLEARGTVRRPPAPPPGVRAGTPHDLDLCDELDRLNRGAARRPDLELMLAHGARLRIVDGEGFSLADGARLLTVSARTPSVAAVLLQDHLAAREVGEAVEVLWITASHQWAVDVLVQAGLGLSPSGALCVRPDADRLRTAYLPTGAYL